MWTFTDTMFSDSDDSDTEIPEVIRDATTGVTYGDVYAVEDVSFHIDGDYIVELDTPIEGANIRTLTAVDGVTVAYVNWGADMVDSDVDVPYVCVDYDPPTGAVTVGDAVCVEDDDGMGVTVSQHGKHVGKMTAGGVLDAAHIPDKVLAELGGLYATVDDTENRGGGVDD